MEIEPVAGTQLCCRNNWLLIASGVVLYVETHMPQTKPVQNELTLSHDFLTCLNLGR